MQTNPAVEQNKNSKWSHSLWNQSGSSMFSFAVKFSTNVLDKAITEKSCEVK